MKLIKLTTSAPPVSLFEAKDHLRIDVSSADLDDPLAPLIPAAVGWFENETRQAITAATFRLYRDGFPAEREIRLPKPPLNAVSAVRYVYSGIEQTFEPAAYTVDPSGSTPGRLTLNPGRSWPTTDDVPNSVRIDFSAGYGGAIPEVLKVGILMHIGHLLAHPEGAIDRRVDEVPLGVRSIVDQFAFPEAI